MPAYVEPHLPERDGIDHAFRPLGNERLGPDAGAELSGHDRHAADGSVLVEHRQGAGTPSHTAPPWPEHSGNPYDCTCCTTASSALGAAAEVIALVHGHEQVVRSGVELKPDRGTDSRGDSWRSLPSGRKEMIDLETARLGVQ